MRSYLAVIMVFLSCIHAQREPVKMTLLSKNHFASEQDSEYQCYLSDDDSNRNGIALQSMRTGWTRDTAADLDFPNPTWSDAKGGNEAFQHYKVAMSNNDDNDAFGVFGCTATKNGKLETNISTTRMRSDAVVVPDNELFTQTVSINDTGVTIRMKGGMDYSTLRWLHNNTSPLYSHDGNNTFSIDRPIQIHDAGIYECFIEGERNEARHGLNLLLVRACPAYTWNPPQCNRVCDSCYNGGVCDEYNGKCICPPGFKGDNCGQACGSNLFGYNCDKKCSSQGGNCRNNLFCLPHPYGCRCITGFEGRRCNEGCSAGKFGASCLQSCHCTSGVCDASTGQCEGNGTCEPGWDGPSCQECSGNSFGLTCSQDCHCNKDKCHSESGLCKQGGCLPQWVDRYPPYSCQTGLTNFTYIKTNRGIKVPVTCTAVEGQGGGLNDLEIRLSRQIDGLQEDNISREDPFVAGTLKTQTFYVEEVQAVFYCQLWTEGESVAVLGPITVDVFDPPQLTLPPTAESVTTTSVTISWSAWNRERDSGDPPVIGYVPYYKKSEEIEWIPSEMISQSTLTFTANGLEPDTNYSFGVSAVRSGEGGEGLRSDELNVSTVCKVPPSPKNVHTKLWGECQGDVKVIWELPTENIACSSGISKLTINYYSSQTSLTSLDVPDLSATSYIVYNLTIGMSYTFSVTMSTSGGESAANNLAEHLVPVLPVLNNAPMLTNAKCSSVTMVWDKWTEEKDIGTPPISHYIPYYRVNDSFAWKSGDKVFHTSTNVKYQFTFHNLAKESSYEFCVVAAREGKGGEGAKNNIILGTTSCAVNPSTPVGLIVSGTIGGIFFLILILLLVAFRNTRRQKIKNKECSRPNENVDHTNLASPEIDAEDIGDGAVYTNVEKQVSIPVEELERYLKNCESGRCATFEQQFSLFNPSKQFPSNVGEREENRPKNRFKNMIAYDHSRVVLEIINGDPYSDYYNANYIKNAEGTVAFIASQGPNKASINDLWRMVVMENIRNIVMLTNVVEGGKDRCFPYWPSTIGETKHFGLIQITLVKEEQFGDYDIRNLLLQMGNGSFEVINWHFRTWPDKDVPHQTTPLIEFCNKVKAVEKKEKSPLLVHCSAGVGRTGTFIALYSLTDVVKKGQPVDVYGFVEQMRKDRINMVQKVSQYKFLHECLLEVYLTGDTKIPMDTMSSLDVDAENMNIQFKLLAKLSRKGPKPHKPTKEESDKMRFPNIAPVDKKLPFLRSPGRTSSTNFINACLVTSYRKRDAFIATQSPLPNTVEDFWRLVYDWRCPLIVMLDQVDSNNKTHCKYWSDNGSSQYGNMEVTIIDRQTEEGYTHRQFDVKHAISEESISVHQMQLTSWDTTNLRTIIKFINDVGQMQRDLSVVAPTAVHCNNGVGRTGVFLAVASELDRLHAEGNFDVFNTVRRLRGSHPNLVYTQDDYRLCHQLLKLACPESQYANV